MRVLTDLERHDMAAPFVSFFCALAVSDRLVDFVTVGSDGFGAPRLSW